MNEKDTLFDQMTDAHFTICIHVSFEITHAITYKFCHVSFL